MKKNIRIASAAAAALLAVAPVAANVVNVNNTVFAKGTNDGSNENNAIDVSLTASTSTQPKNGDKGDVYNGKVNVAVASSAGTASTSASKWVAMYGDRAMTSADIFKAGFSYSFKGTATITGLDPDKYYSVNGGTAVKPNAAGTITDIAVSTPVFNLTDSSISGNPYFSYTNPTTKTTVSLNNGATVNAVAADATNTATVLKNATDLVKFNANSNQDSGIITTTAKDVADQLAKQGITVDNNGNFSNPENGFYITLTGMNKQNGKTATVVVAFNGKAADYNNYPVIKLDSVKKAQGKESTNVTTDKFTVNNGASFDAVNPNGLKITAEQNSKNNNLIDVKTVSNPVNTKVAGDYTVTVQATNVDGLTTLYSYKVTVKAPADNSNIKTVHYVPGYGVNVWNILPANQVAFANKRVLDGTQVTVYGEQTVNGTKYYAINKDKTEWLQAGYLDDATSTTTNNGETAVSGIATVHYNGKGGVALLNGAGKYQAQWVSNGSRWKVFAKKTVNGRVMYRLGTDNQWIPADYVTVD